MGWNDSFKSEDDLLKAKVQSLNSQGFNGGGWTTDSVKKAIYDTYGGDDAWWEDAGKNEKLDTWTPSNSVNMSGAPGYTSSIDFGNAPSWGTVDLSGAPECGNVETDCEA